MKEKSKKLTPDPRGFPLFKKIGICIFIQGVFVETKIISFLFHFIENEKKKELSQEEATEIMKEVASYIFFRTIEQVEIYRQKESLPEDDMHNILDVVLSYFHHTYYIDNFPEKIEEYSSVVSPLILLSTKIENIVNKGKSIITDHMQITLIIKEAIKSFLPIGETSKGIARIFKLSEEKMAELIEDFFVNVYPRLIERKD